MAKNKKAPEELKKEIATIARDITRATFGGVLLNNRDDTLLTRGSAKGLKIYDDIERDCHAYAVLQKRKTAVVAREWDIFPASKSAIDVAAADLVKETLGAVVSEDDESVPGGMLFDKITMDLLDATLKGFSVAEIMWAVQNDRIVPNTVIPRDQRRFIYDLNSTLRLLTMEDMTKGEALPERKFIIHRFGAKDGDPYGLGLGHKLFWPVFFKRQDITFWLTFADKFGSPTPLGKYPNGTLPKDQEKLLQVLAAISQDAGVVVPEGMIIELLEAARSGSADTYEKLARYMDEQISECVLGETMTTTAKAAGLGSNQADVHNDVRKELAKADADQVCETLNSTIIRWIVDLNMPGAGYPKVWRNFEEEEDLKAHAEKDKLIYDMGFDPTEEYIRAKYGEGWVKRQAPTAPVSPFGGPAASGAPATFAEVLMSGAAINNRADQQALADAAEELSAQWKTFVGRPVEDVIALLDETKDLVLFRERLDGLLHNGPPKEIVETVARAIFAAHVLGRAPPRGKK